MTDSNASLPQRRCDALRQQLVDALSQGDQLAIKRIERQWVHRYGIEALSQLMSEPLLLNDHSEGSDIAVDTDDLASTLHALSADVSDAVSCEESLTASPDCAEPSSTEAGIDLSGDADVTAETFVAAQRLSGISLVALEQVLPPPVPRLHRLRRWIPTAANGLPKAS